MPKGELLQKYKLVTWFTKQTGQPRSAGSFRRYSLSVGSYHFMRLSLYIVSRWRVEFGNLLNTGRNVQNFDRDILIGMWYENLPESKRQQILTDIQYFERY